ncbi:hypothetical protein ACHQM5_013484 [Ranunculus cassubicifolius]
MNVAAEDKASVTQTVSDRRQIRSRYLNVKNSISDKRDDIGSKDLQKFKSLFQKVESIHDLVYKPREQVADAEAFLDIASTLGVFAKAENNGGISPSDFVTSLLRDYCYSDDPRSSIAWGDIGLHTSHIFKKAAGCCTMFGPMNNQVKQRKVAVRRKRVRETESARPDELDSAETENSDTDKNMVTMFNILKKKKSVQLEHLILNRKSFAQTVENLFAFSFLVKDGRAKISVDENNRHLVSPKNAPSAEVVSSKEVSYFHFVFRLDFQDWKLMKDFVGVGEELMPHRSITDEPNNSKKEPECQNVFSVTPAPIKTYSRNRGLVVQEQFSLGDDMDMEGNKSP